MNLSRDIIQGFIDGYITAGGDPSTVDVAVTQYAKTHPNYAVDDAGASRIAGDLGSYRVTAQEILAPTPVSVITQRVL